MFCSLKIGFWSPRLNSIFNFVCHIFHMKERENSNNPLRLDLKELTIWVYTLHSKRVM